MAKPAKPLLTDEYRLKVHKALRKRHQKHLRGGEDFVDFTAATESDGWTLTITFQNRDRSVYLPVETALLATENPDLKPQEAMDVLVDFIDYYFAEYFSAGREATLPLDWSTFPYGDFTVRARGWERNLRLEEAADRLLAGEDPGL